MLFTVEGFPPAQQFGVDLRKLLDLILQLTVMLDALADGVPLGRCFEQKLVDVTGGQALGQEVKGPVFIPAMMAVAVGFAATGEPLDQGGAQEVGEDFELGEEPAFAMAQGQSGFALGGVNPCHIYGKDTKTANDVNEKENAFLNANVPNPAPEWELHGFSGTPYEIDGFRRFRRFRIRFGGIREFGMRKGAGEQRGAHDTAALAPASLGSARARARPRQPHFSSEHKTIGEAPMGTREGAYSPLKASKRRSVKMRQECGKGGGDGSPW